MKNLLQETLDILKSNKKTSQDVKWIGTTEFGKFTWEDFERLADISYDSGYGGNKITSDLVIVGKNWWLERGEYDGAEWWEFKTLPKAPKINKVPFTLKTGWRDLSETEEM